MISRMSLPVIPLGDFTGGLNVADGAFALGENESPDLMNVVLGVRNNLSQRPGKTAFATVAATVDNLRNWYTPSLTLLMASINGTVYSITTAGAPASRFAGTASKVWCFEQAKDSANADRLWMNNGTDTPQKWDGVTASTTAWLNTPPNGTMLRQWRGRMIIAGVAAQPQRVYFSDVGNPESPAATYGNNFVDVRGSEDDTDPITWLEIVQDNLVVFKKRSVWVIYDPVAFSMRRLGSPGCEDRFQSVNSMGKCYFFHRSGLWSIADLVNPPILESRKVNPLITAANMTALDKVRVAASVDDQRILIAFPAGASTTNNRLLELYLLFKDEAWSLHNYTISSLSRFRLLGVDVLMAGDSASAKIHQLFTGTSDDGVAISSWWQSSWKPIVREEKYERLRRLNLEMSGQLVIDVMTNLESAIKFSAFLNTGIQVDPLWDGSTWDGGVWTEVGLTKLMRARPETRGRYHAVKFRNDQLNQTFVIQAAELVFRGGKEH